MNEKDLIGLLYIQSDALDGLVQAGDSADRTIKAIMRNMPHERRKVLVYWLEQAHKESKRILHDGEIATFAAGVKAEAAKGPAPTYEVNGKTYKHQKPKAKPEAPPSLLDMFGMS